MAEIQRCRPYFIGLLGERYGWVPDEIPQELIEQEPWLAEHLHHSVTELEILHGVLNNPAMSDHALFYFRDPGSINTLSFEQRPDYLELPSEDEIAKLGQQGAERRAEERRQNLAALKDRIRASGLPVHENYPNPQALGQSVLHDLTAIIDHLYPKGSEPNSLDRDALDHEAFAQNRARVYIGRQEYFERLNEYAQSDGLPLVMLGLSGSGKSALLSNWALGYRDAHPDELVLMHFIGATPYSADWVAMLRRIMGELKRRFDIEQEIPGKSDELRAAFANWLHMTAVNHKVVLILDALNQLEDRDGAPDLVWIPPVIPAGIRLIVSALPSSALDELTKRGWPTMQIEPLEFDERRQLIKDYLGQRAKQLSPADLYRIASAHQTANPLYLRAMLDELCVFGVYEQLNARIEGYLGAVTPDKLYEKILERYEQDYERERPGLVRDAMSLLWAARRGLSQTELLELLGENGEPLPQAHWSPLFLAAEAALINRSGLSAFGHDYLRQAVQRRYLLGEEDRQKAHLRLAIYFDKLEVQQREVEELPWQLAEARSWHQLATLLAFDLSFLVSAFKHNPSELKNYWTRIEDNLSVRMVDMYSPLVESVIENTDGAGLGLLSSVATLFQERGHYTEAISVRNFLVDHYRQTGDRQALANSLGNHAVTLRDLGQLSFAMTLLREQEQLFRALGDKNGLQASLGNQATVLMARNEHDEAMILLKEVEQICREMTNVDGLARSLGNQALVLMARGELGEAMTLFKEVEKVWRRLGNKDGLQSTFGNQGVILHKQNRLDESIALFRQKEELARELGNKDGLASSLGNRALILMEQHQEDTAMSLLIEAEQLSRKLGNPERIAIWLSNRALLLAHRMSQPHEALPLVEEAYQLASDHGLTGLVQQIKPLLDSILRQLRMTPAQSTKDTSQRSTYVPTPHQGADPDRAFRLNLAHQQDLARWKAFPWLRRLITKKPEPPRGI